MSKRKFTPFQSFETNLTGDNGKGINEQHVRLTRSLILSPAYKDLGKNACKILNAMKLVSKGNVEFTFSASLGVFYLGLNENCEKSVRLAIKELLNHGFIVRTTFSNGAGHISNSYRFSGNWKHWKK